MPWMVLLFHPSNSATMLERFTVCSKFATVANKDICSQSPLWKIQCVPSLPSNSFSNVDLKIELPSFSQELN